ncbi:MAG TPA: peptidase [Vibrio sp.]|nr:peptidase [Vibrio sp.]
MSQTLELALCRQLPKTIDGWVLLIPAGDFTGDDGRTWSNSQPEQVIANSDLNNIPWDIEHATHLKGAKGEPAPAYGWISKLEIRNGEIWGLPEFNVDGKEIIEKRSYRYYSPGFYFDITGLVKSIQSVGFTNQPNLKKDQLTALNRKENAPMNLSKAIVAALGLTETATEADAVTAIDQLKTDHQLALNRANQPDLENFVPTETYQLALNRAKTAEDKLAEQHEQEITALVDGAVAEGKVAPANKDMYLATCRAEGGIAQFKSFLESAPTIANSTSKHKKSPEQGDKKLSEEQLAVCRKLGVTEEEFLAAQPV